jgi:Domain of unknown function (DUF397)
MDGIGSAQWRKSSYSGGNGGACVEVAAVAGSKDDPGRVVAVRDSKNPAGAILVFTADEWRAFTVAVRGGAFELG